MVEAGPEVGKGPWNVWLLIRGLRLATSGTPLPGPRIDGAQLDIISIIAALKSKQAAMDTRSEERQDLADGVRSLSFSLLFLSCGDPGTSRPPASRLTEWKDQPWEQLPRQRMTKLG